MRFFKRKDEIELSCLVVEKEMLLHKVATLDQRLNEATADNQKIIDTARQIENERDKLKTMVREQTDADLLVNALRGLGMIPNPPKLNTSEEDYRLRYMQQQAAAQQASMSLYGRYNHGLLGGLGNFF